MWVGLQVNNGCLSINYNIAIITNIIRIVFILIYFPTITTVIAKKNRLLALTNRLDIFL